MGHDRLVVGLAVAKNQGSIAQSFDGNGLAFVGKLNQGVRGGGLSIDLHFPVHHVEQDVALRLYFRLQLPPLFEFNAGGVYAGQGKYRPLGFTPFPGNEIDLDSALIQLDGGDAVLLEADVVRRRHFQVGRQVEPNLNDFLHTAVFLKSFRGDLGVDQAAARRHPLYTAGVDHALPGHRVPVHDVSL